MSAAVVTGLNDAADDAHQEIEIAVAIEIDRRRRVVAARARARRTYGSGTGSTWNDGVLHVRADVLNQQHARLEEVAPEQVEILVAVEVGKRQRVGAMARRRPAPRRRRRRRRR